MTSTTLYVVRHGKTMFNTLGRAQGWCDSPLTSQGREGIRELGRGFKANGVRFSHSVTSDSGRTLETRRLILEELGQEELSHTIEPRLREWCFGSLEGLYDEELFNGVLPRALALDNGQSLSQLTYPEMAKALVVADTAGWAEPWTVLRERIWSGFTDLAQSVAAAGGGDVLVVCHGMTIATLLWLIAPDIGQVMLDNGSVSLLTYTAGEFAIQRAGDLSYRALGREVIARETD